MKNAWAILVQSGSLVLYQSPSQGQDFAHSAGDATVTKAMYRKCCMTQHSCNRSFKAQQPPCNSLLQAQVSCCYGRRVQDPRTNPRNEVGVFLMGVSTRKGHSLRLTTLGLCSLSGGVMPTGKVSLLEGIHPSPWGETFRNWITLMWLLLFTILTTPSYTTVPRVRMGATLQAGHFCGGIQLWSPEAL